MDFSFTGNMRLSYSSGKPDPMARDENGMGRADAGRSSKIAVLMMSSRHNPPVGFVRSYCVGGRREHGRYRRAQGVAKVDDLVPTSNRARNGHSERPSFAALNHFPADFGNLEASVRSPQRRCGSGGNMGVEAFMKCRSETAAGASAVRWRCAAWRRRSRGRWRGRAR